MKSPKYEIAEMCIRSDLNLIYLSSKFITNCMAMAERIPLARQALRSAAELIFTQAADIYGRILRDYPDEADEPAPQAAEAGEAIKKGNVIPLQNNISDKEMMEGVWSTF